jgi:hypothetical protein
MVGPWKLDHLLSDLQVFDLGSIRPVPVELLRLAVSLEVIGALLENLELVGDRV